MKVFYTDHFVLPLPPEHRFPMTKYSRLRQRVATSPLFTPHDLRVPEAATDEELTRAHSRDYVDNVCEGRLTVSEIRRIGFPWSPEMVERSRRSSGATIAACRAALQDGASANLAGGTHHAFRDCGEGYCVFNDSVIAARAMQAEGLARRVVILDCDVHQGNGTAAIVADDPSIFSFSIHGAKNFPFRKQTSDLDVALDDGVGDDVYLDALRVGVSRAIDLAQADLAIYLAGADPFIHDRFGRLAMTKEGLATRDEIVLEMLRAKGIPVAITMAGGYAPNVDDIVDIHFATVARAAIQLAR